MSLFAFYNEPVGFWLPRQLDETRLKLDPSPPSVARTYAMLGSPIQDRIGDLFKLVTIVKGLQK